MKPAGIAQLAQLYLDIALFRRGPEDVPGSSRVLGLTVGAYFILNFALSVLLLPSGFAESLGQMVFAVAFMAAWYRGMLKLAGRPERFIQTASALFGYQTVLAPLSVGALKFMPANGQMPTLPGAFILGALAVWTLAVNGRVLRAATGWPLFVCIGTFVLQTIVAGLLFALLFGTTGAT
jgi:hypothetical protein